MQTRAAARKAEAEAEATVNAQYSETRAETPDRTTANKESHIVAKQRQLLLTPPADFPRVMQGHRLAGVTPPVVDKTTEKNLKKTVQTGSKRNYDGKNRSEPVSVRQGEGSPILAMPWTPKPDSDAPIKQAKIVAQSATDTAQGTLIQAPGDEPGTNADVLTATANGRYELRTRKTVSLKIHTAATTIQKVWLASDAAPEESGGTTSRILDDNDDESPAKRQRHSESTTRVASTTEFKDGGNVEVVVVVKQKRKARRTKENPYGLTPGETPYPDWVAPTPQQCRDMYNFLVEVHDDVKSLPPDNIPAPSLDVAGCGEVPSVLDGLIRTVLSASTTFDSADKMLQALVKRFGIVESGIGKGSVNWNKVRTAAYDDVYAQLKNGGLGGVKAKTIQAILSMVYEENMIRRASYLGESNSGERADAVGKVVQTQGQKELEILKTDKEMLSLDHMHSMETHEAIQHFVQYPGVGVKTAACVALFSLQRPCFAVDTHVYRLSKWLGWVPKKTNEDDTFSHLEVRCPDNLKYGLHQLFIRHGKTCHRCNDKSFSGTDAWEAASCPLEHLIDRFTKRAVKPKEAKVKIGETEKIEGTEDADGTDGVDAGMDETELDEGVPFKVEDEVKTNGTTPGFPDQDAENSESEMLEVGDSGLQG